MSQVTTAKTVKKVPFVGRSCSLVLLACPALSVLTLCDICSYAEIRRARAAALQVCRPLAVASVHIEKQQPVQA